MPKPKLVIPFKAEELSAISDRLIDRAESIHQFSLQDLIADLRVAAKAVELLAHIRAEISQIADKCTDADAARELRDVLGDTGAGDEEAD